ncbi:YcaO-like family protein [Amycolatopsis halotolerans]|uniref:YcaO-like family protein n=1 Tax=Amycolatopsis halotolerans TaxID=330083 RepID=A0ABV7QF91_9PSEU
MVNTDSLVTLQGTVRAASPQQTWESIADRLLEFGISRVSRLTGLDNINIPVWAATRPASLTLSVSQGKGADDLLAKLSAVMEAIELWHVEQPLPVIAVGTAADVEPGYPISGLPMSVQYPERIASRITFEWTAGTTVVHGSGTLIPVDLIRRPIQRHEWSPALLRATTTGLACGNTRNEALLHALFEVVERDALYRDSMVDGALRTPVDPESVDDAYGQDIIGKFTAADMQIELALVRNPYDLPVCLAYLFSEDFPVAFAGSGCHSDPAIALTRAMTEAAQSRLTAIAGTRDDLPSDFGSFNAPAFFSGSQSGRAPWRTATCDYEAIRTGFGDQVADIASRLMRFTGHEPLALDLSSSPGPIVAVQVVCPGTASRITRTMRR